MYKAEESYMHIIYQLFSITLHVNMYTSIRIEYQNQQSLFHQWELLFVQAADISVV